MTTQIAGAKFITELPEGAHWRVFAGGLVVAHPDHPTLFYEVNEWGEWVEKPPQPPSNSAIVTIGPLPQVYRVGPGAQETWSTRKRSWKERWLTWPWQPWVRAIHVYTREDD